jgi:excisionase family DNA binding protein
VPGAVPENAAGSATVPVEAAAELLGATVEMVNEWIHLGCVRAFRIDGVVRVRRSDLEEFSKHAFTSRNGEVRPVDATDPMPNRRGSVGLDDSALARSVAREIIRALDERGNLSAIGVSSRSSRKEVNECRDERLEKNEFSGRTESEQDGESSWLTQEINELRRRTRLKRKPCR